MNMKTSFITILVGLSLTGVTATLLYLLLRKDEEDNEDNLKEGRVQTSRSGTIEVKIPRESVGIVIGRGGRNIKDIQEKADAKINFKDDQENLPYRECVIRGAPESAQLAESLIHELISNQPLLETSVMWVPQRACGRIIGKNGENIRGISRASSAKITIDPDGAREGCPQRRVTIIGTSEQIELAKALIQEKVEEDNELRKKLEKSLANRSPRKKDRLQCITAGEDVQNIDEKSFRERLHAPGNDSLMEVYVSGLKHPSCFWLQVKGPQSVELDHLVDHMTDYYKNEENQKLHVIRELDVGQVVAAPTGFDDNWYRAEVTALSEDDYDPQESLVSLLYLDYGDSGDIHRKQVMELRTDFLRLRFQAIECSLAKVMPSGDDWSEEAIQLFDELTHVAQWITLMARVDSYKERPKNPEGCTRREGSPVPCVELYDARGSQDISVAEELVKQGFANWEKGAPSSSRNSSPKVNGKPQTPSTPTASGSTLTLPSLSDPRSTSTTSVGEPGDSRDLPRAGQANGPGLHAKQRATTVDTSRLSQNGRGDEGAMKPSTVLDASQNTEAEKKHARLIQLLKSNSPTKMAEQHRQPILQPDIDDVSSDELEMY